jgi:hypothetical protein
MSMREPRCPVKKTLLLNNNYEVLQFIVERKLFKLLYKDKLWIEETWQQDLPWLHGIIKYPAVVRLKNMIKRNFTVATFSRGILIKRDKNQCQYCGIKLPYYQITVDHVIPKSQGGTHSFTNCVVACHPCNNRKDNKTPEQAGMKLLNLPTHPSFSAHHSITDNQDYWHPSWDGFLSNS